MSGATIANEIRAIAAGLAGKRLDAIQVSDLMINTSKVKGDSKSARQRRSSQTASRDDRAAAESYHRAWARSIQAKMKDIETNKTPKTSKPNRKRPISRRS